MTKVALKAVKVYEVIAADGESLGLFRLDSTWQGMRCLRSMDGKATLVVEGLDVDANAFGAIFGDIFPDLKSEVFVVKATPHLARHLLAAGEQPDFLYTQTLGGE